MASQKGAIDDTAVGGLLRRDFVPLGDGLARPLVLGIDPGLHGAVAVVDCDRMVLVDMIDLPTFKTPTKARKQGFFEHLDVHALSSEIDMYAPHVALAVLEEPGAMPKQGLSSTFRFGHICGQIHGVLAGHYIPTATVKPAVWKSALGLGQDKDDSMALATTHFRQHSDLWKQKQHNDRAEAALLTVYGLRYLKKLIDLSRGAEAK